MDQRDAYLTILKYGVDSFLLAPANNTSIPFLQEDCLVIDVVQTTRSEENRFVLCL